MVQSNFSHAKGQRTEENRKKPLQTIRYKYPYLVYTKPVNSAFRARFG